MKIKMSKKIILGLASVVLLAGVGIVTTYPKPVEAGVSRIIKVFVTNWPSVQNTAEQNRDTNGNIKVHEQGTANSQITNWPINQNVTITNPLPMPVLMQKPQTRTVILGSKEVHVNYGDKISLPEPQQKVLYASYQGEGRLKYLTAVGPNGLGVQIWIDGEVVAQSDSYDIETIFGSATSNGWKVLMRTDRHSALEINKEYPFHNEIRIYLYRATSHDELGGAHIELEID